MQKSGVARFQASPSKRVALRDTSTPIEANVFAYAKERLSPTPLSVDGWEVRINMMYGLFPALIGAVALPVGWSYAAEQFHGISGADSRPGGRVTLICIVLIRDARQLQKREHAEALRNLVLHEWFLMLDRRPPNKSRSDH